MMRYYVQSVVKVVLMSVAGIFLSCDADEPDVAQEPEILLLTGEHGTKYNKSNATWSELKQEKGNSYNYQVSFSSWTGFTTATTLTVEKGKVIQRRYEEYVLTETGEKDISDAYTETKDLLGSNEKGAEVLTIDELYGACASEYLAVDEKENSLFFDTQDNGIMRLCGYNPNDCADDCFKGVRISAFEWL